MVSEPAPSPPSPSPSPSSFAEARDALSSSLVDLSHRLKVFQVDLAKMFQAIEAKLDQFTDHTGADRLLPSSSTFASADVLGQIHDKFQQFQPCSRLPMPLDTACLKPCIKIDGEMETKPTVDSILQQSIVDLRPGSSVLDSNSVSVSPTFHHEHRMESMLEMPLDIMRLVPCIQPDSEMEIEMDFLDSTVLGSVEMYSSFVLPPAVDVVLPATVKISFELASPVEDIQVLKSEVPFVRSIVLVIDEHKRKLAFFGCLLLDYCIPHGRPPPKPPPSTMEFWSSQYLFTVLAAYHCKPELLSILAQQMFDIMLPPTRPPSDIIFFHVGIAGNVCQVFDEVSVAWMLPKMAFFSLYLFTHIQCCDGYVYRPPPKPPPFTHDKSLQSILWATCLRICPLYFAAAGLHVCRPPPTPTTRLTNLLLTLQMQFSFT